jgi:hypothetical protein
MPLSLRAGTRPAGSALVSAAEQEADMADNTGGMSFLGFVLGGVVVVMAVLAFVIYGGQGTGPKTVNLELPTATAPN